MMLNSRPVRLLATLKNSAMAYPDLQLYIASDATYHDIGQFLDIDFNNCTAPSDGYFRARQRIGRIGLWWKTDVAFEWGQYEASWMRMLSFRCPYSWLAIHDHIVLDLCYELNRRFPGTYLGLYDTGMFLLRDNVLSLNVDSKEYFSRGPLRFQSANWQNLPPI